MFFRKEDVLQELEQGADAPEKTGPARFLELIKDELATVLIVNLLFLVTCLPIVTIPPAGGAQNHSGRGGGERPGLSGVV